MPYEVALEVFQGPFDLLLHLIEKDEIDIYDIPIARITDQFLEYLHSMTLVDVDLASDFLVMAATLMQIKARMLVPRLPFGDAEEEGSEDPRTELAEKLLQYKRFKEASLMLRGMAEYWSHVYTRQIDEVIDDSVEYVPDLRGITIEDIARAFSKVLEASKDDNEALSTVSHEVYTIHDQMIYLRALIHQRSCIRFFDIFEADSTRGFVVATFLAILELIRLQEIRARQERLFGDFVIERAIAAEAARPEFARLNG